MSFLGSPARKAAECGQAIICLPCTLCCGGTLMAIIGVMMLVSAVTDTRGHSIEKYNEAVLKWKAEGFPKFSNSTPAMTLFTKRADGANPREVPIPKKLWTGVPTGDAPGNTQDDHIETYDGAYFGPKTESLFSIDTNENHRQFDVRVEQSGAPASDVYKSSLTPVKLGDWSTVTSVTCDRDDSLYTCEQRCREHCRGSTPKFGECRSDGRQCKTRKMLVGEGFCLQMDVSGDSWTGAKGCFQKEQMLKWTEATEANFNTEVTLRHSLDPYITLMRETGDGRFGATQGEKAAMGTALTVVGVLMVVFVIACVLCLKNTFLDIYHSRKGGAATPIMGQQQQQQQQYYQQNQGYVAHQPYQQQQQPVYQQQIPPQQQYQQQPQQYGQQPQQQRGYGY